MLVSLQLLFGLFLSISCQLKPNPIYGQSTLCVQVTEIYPNPNVGETEWLELYNCGENDVNLSGWQVFDELSSPSLLLSFDEQSLPAGEYFSITLPANKLNNSGDGVKLYDQNQVLMDQMSYLSSFSGISWSWNEQTNTFLLTEPTPNLPNVFPTPTLAPTLTPTSTPTYILTPTVTPIPVTPPDLTGLQLTEIVACPTDQEGEWLELFWPNAQTLTIKDWHLIDNQSNTISINTNLAANSYTIVEWQKNLLNNTGDKLEITDQNGEKIFSLTLPACQTGESLALINQSFQLIANITKGSPNPSYPTPTPSSTPLSITPTIISTHQNYLIQGDYENKPVKSAVQQDAVNTKLEYQIPRESKKTIIDLQELQPSILPNLTVIIGGFGISTAGLLFLYGKKE